MTKLKAVLTLIGVVVVANLIMMITVPDILVPMANTANTTMAATSNMSNYPGLSAAVVSTPWTSYLLINGIGLLILIIILRRPSPASA